MGLMDRIKKVTGTNDSYDDSYDDDYYNGFDTSYDEGIADDDVQIAGDMGNTQPIGNAPMSGMNNAPAAGTGNIGFSGSNIKMRVVYPRTYDSETASQIANQLLNKCAVFLNLEHTNKETSRRLIDFLSGVAYSIGGSLRRIAVNAYVITPSNVEVDEAKLKTAAPKQEAPSEQKMPNDEFTDFN